MNADLKDYNVIILWPESQKLMGFKGFRENAVLINSDYGLDQYGSSAYRIDKDWFERIKTHDLEYSEEMANEIPDNDDNELSIDWDFDESDDDICTVESI